MFTLDNFYTSRTWAKFLEQLRQERTNENGELLCERCGKPILRKYDCIGHHVKELTEDNVNDYEISLNPGNIKLIHLRCHNEEHQRFGGFHQEVYLVYGSPCSGKSSWVDKNAYGDDLILDVDRLWDAVCNDGRYNKVKLKSTRPTRLRPIVFGLRDCIIDQIRTRSGMWRNAFIIGGYPLRTDRDRLCNLLRAKPIYIESTLEECLKRAETERPEEWKQYIRDWFENYIE